MNSKLFAVNLLLTIITILLCSGCAENELMTIKHSEAIYKSVINPETKSFEYTPEPLEIIEIKAKVRYSDRLLVDSMSISKEETITMLTVEQRIPNHENVSNVKLIYWTYHFDPPLAKNDSVLLLFDERGNFIDALRE